MNYLVSDYTKKGKVFATFEEARGYANEIFMRTGYVLCVTKTKRKVTHVYTF